MRLAGAFRRAREIVREDGLLALWFRILGETVYRRVLLLRWNMPEEPARPDIAARWLQPDEAATYSEFHREVPLEEVQRRLAAGERCFILLSGGRFVHGLWVAPRRAWIDYLQMEFPLEAGEVYLYQSYTPAEERGRGFATTALHEAYRVLKREGYVRTVACIQPDRSLAYPPVLKAGSEPYGYLGWFGMGPWHRPFRRATNRFPFYAPRVRTGR